MYREARSWKHLTGPVAEPGIYPAGDGEPSEEAVSSAAVQSSAVHLLNHPRKQNHFRKTTSLTKS